VAALFLLALVPVPASGSVVSLNPIKDNTLFENATGDLSNGAGSWFIAGNTNNTNTLKKRRGLIQFDLSGIPATATITAVTLTMTNDRGKNGSPNVELHRVLASWGEGTSVSDANPGKGAPSTTNDATWAHRFYPGTLWATPGGDFDPTVSASVAVGNSANYNWSSAQMISDVQQWVSNPANNFGWLIKGDEINSATARRFKSRDAGTTPPVLQVTYTTGGTATGACCTGANCQELTAADCAVAGGVYKGDGTVCATNPCATATGACCATNGTCTTGSQTQCAGSGGTYQGDGTSCSPNPCSIQLAPFLDALPIPAVATPTSGTAGGTASYTIAMTELNQQLHSQLPATRVWGYGGGYPGPTIEASTDNPVTVTWVSDLRDAQGNLRTSHYLAVDPCMDGPDMWGDSPRTVVHLHGGHVPSAVDGYPENTILPGQQTTYVYPNHQDAATLWYHDHAMGITRLNVMMGLAGFYLLRDGIEKALTLPNGPNEIAMAIQDRSFNPDGTLKYPALWDEMFFGDKILVNGKVWPFLNVKKGKYRFRILDGSNSRVYTLSLSNGAPFWVIGDEQGLLPKPLMRTSITITPGERTDLVIDFQPYANNTQITLVNSAPAPYPGTPGVGVIPNVMRFVVVPGGGAFTSPLPATLRAVNRIPETDASRTRTLDLYKVPGQCGYQKWTINGLGFSDIQEYPQLGSTEIWKFVNRSGLVHPMHMHLVAFQVLDRQPFTVDPGGNVVPSGPAVPPDSMESGWKDTAPVNPFEILRVIARFTDYTGLYPYHCHVLEHEDNEMMRQFQVVEPTAVAPVPTSTGVRLGPSYPNPTTGPVHLVFSLSKPARVSAEIEDVGGRHVATVAARRVEGGAHELVWDGRIASGASAAPGIYFYRLVIDGGSTSARRLVIFR
jgi:spore coat protein A